MERRNQNRAEHEGETYMRRGDPYRKIGYILKRASCDTKERYTSRSEAGQAAHAHERRIIFAEMTEYWCYQHDCWHIGHRDKRRAAYLSMIEHNLWFDTWYSRN